MACMGHSWHWAPDYYAPVPSLSRDSARRGMTARPLISTVDKAVQRHCTGVPDIHFWACVSGRFRYYWRWSEPYLAWPHEAYMWTDCRASSAELVQVLISEIIFPLKSYFALNKLRKDMRKTTAKQAFNVGIPILTQKSWKEHIFRGLRCLGSAASKTICAWEGGMGTLSETAGEGEKQHLLYTV